MLCPFRLLYIKEKHDRTENPISETGNRWKARLSRNVKKVKLYYNCRPSRFLSPIKADYGQEPGRFKKKTQDEGIYSAHFENFVAKWSAVQNVRNIILWPTWETLQTSFVAYYPPWNWPMVEHGGFWTPFPILTGLSRLNTPQTKEILPINPGLLACLKCNLPDARGWIG